MEFCIGKCATVIMKSGKRETTKGTELPNQENIRTLGKKLQLFGNIRIGQNQTSGDERKKMYLRRTRKLLETKLCSRNLIEGISNWTVFLFKILKAILEMDEERQMNQRTSKLMTMHQALLLRDDIGRLCVSEKEGKRGLVNIEDGVEATILGVEEYINE